MEEWIDKIIKEIVVEPNEVNISSLIKKLQFYVLSLNEFFDDNDVKGDQMEFMTDLITNLVYLCAKVPELLIPIIVVFIEDDWFRDQLNEFEKDDVYHIFVLDDKKKEE